MNTLKSRKKSPFFDSLEEAVRSTIANQGGARVSLLKLHLKDWKASPKVQLVGDLAPSPDLQPGAFDSHHIEIDPIIRVRISTAPGLARFNPKTNDCTLDSTQSVHLLESPCITGPQRNPRQLAIDKQRVLQSLSLDEMFFNILAHLTQEPTFFKENNLLVSAQFKVTTQRYVAGMHYTGWLHHSYDTYVQLVRHWSEETLKQKVQPLNDHLLLELHPQKIASANLKRKRQNESNENDIVPPSEKKPKK